MSYLLGVIQLTSGAESKYNYAKVEEFAEQAKQLGCKLIALPEVFACFCKEEDKLQLAEDSENPPSLDFLCKLASRLQMYILGGSIQLLSPAGDSVINRSYLVDKHGKVLDFYDKIHLFDVTVNGQQYFESAMTVPGNRVVNQSTELGNLGLSICYDLRFPELYRQLSGNGAEIVFVPAAFTPKTGRDHWEVLLRARAIENQIYIVAPNQYGKHQNGLRTSGRSLVIDPWGTVLTRKGAGEGLIIAEINLDYLHQLRQKMPCLEHRRI